MPRLSVGTWVMLHGKTSYDHNVERFERGRYNQLGQQYIVDGFSDTALFDIRTRKRIGVILRIEKWGDCPIWYGRNVLNMTDLCAHVQFAGEKRPHIVMLCHLRPFQLLNFECLDL